MIIIAPCTVDVAWFRPACVVKAGIW